MEKQINLTCKRAERTFELVEWDETLIVKGYEVYNGDEPVCFISKCDTLENWEATTFDNYQNCEGLVSGDTKREVLENIDRLLREGTLYLTWDDRKAKRNAELEARKRRAEKEQDERNYNAIVEWRKAKAEKEAIGDYVAELEAKEAKEAKALVKRSGFTVEKDNGLEGQLKWEIRHEDYDLLDFLCENIDQLWATKQEAVEQLGFFLQSEAYQKYVKCGEACELFYELDDNGLVDTSHYDTALCQKDAMFHWNDELGIGDVENVVEYFKTLKQIIKLERKAEKLVVFG